MAAAVSLGIDAGAADVTDLLWKAVAFVRSLPERGAWSPEPDVVAATHRALKLAAQAVVVPRVAGWADRHGCGLSAGNPHGFRAAGT